MSRRAAGWALTSVLLGGALTACGGGTKAPTIDAPEFTAAAAALCAERLPPLRADITDDSPKEPAEVAPVVEARADDLKALVDDLREIDAPQSARAEIDAWLADWDTYVAVGRRYASSLRSDDPDAYSAVAAEGNGPQARISDFARANGFEACALDGVPLPERESPI